MIMNELLKLINILKYISSIISILKLFKKSLNKAKIPQNIKTLQCDIQSHLESESREVVIIKN